MSPARRIVAALVTAVAVAGIVGLSRMPTPVAGVDGALLRLSWRLRGVSIEECRTLSREELEALPAHMRRTEECTGRTVGYLLRVDVDGRVAVRDTVRSRGARRGRPLYVFRDVPLSRGDHHVAVTFEAMIPDDFDAGDQQLVYRWEGSVRLGRGEIALVTLDDAASRLVRAGPG